MERLQCYCFAIEPILLFKDEARFPFLETIERYKTKKLNSSTLDEVVNERYRHDGFRKYDVILTRLLEFSLRVAKPLH